MIIAILGAGAWGTALSIALSPDHAIRLWGHDTHHLDSLRATRLNQRYLPTYPIPEAVDVCPSLADALKAADLALVVTPTGALREVIDKLRSAAVACPIIWGCKGFEQRTGLLPHQVVAEVLSTSHPAGVLSGPSFAQEVAAGKPAALTLASTHSDTARNISRALHSRRLRVYSSEDVIGVEVGGAVKNIMAIAAGICDGMQLGNNARAALITRGLAEITRLGTRLGGRAETFMGLTGLGDLVLTCTGDLSRNRQVGLQLAQGERLPDILRRLGHVAEGVNTTREVASLAHRLSVDMPITQAVYRVLYEDVPAAQALQELMSREQRAER